MASTIDTMRVVLQDKVYLFIITNVVYMEYNKATQVLEIELPSKELYFKPDFDMYYQYYPDMTEEEVKEAFEIGVLGFSEIFATYHTPAA